VHFRGRSVLEVLAALAATTVVVWALELGLDVDHAGTLYLLAVAVTAIRQGTAAALVSAVGAFVIYNLLFVEPRFTLAVARPEELITLFLLLFVGLVIGRLGGAQRERQQLAARREREARALFAISRELATAPRLASAVGTVLDRVRADAGMTRAWVGLGPTIAGERPVGDTASNPPIEQVGTHAVLRRDRPEDAATWVRIHTGSGSRAGGSATTMRYRIALIADGAEIGSLWSERSADAGPPTLEETRLMAATADQLAQAVRRDRLAAAAADAEVERRSDELRSALLDSVSHDLRTPLATIRAAAGSLADPAIDLGDDERRATARAIDEEADRLNRLVDSLLDMSRIQSGALVTDLEVTPLGELLDPILERHGPQLAGRLTVRIPDDLPLVHVDQTFLSQALANVLDNAVTHSSPDADIVVSAEASGDGVEIRVEDSGPGVSIEALPHLFDRFYRAPGAGIASRHGVGLGLTVVRGLVEATGGTVGAAANALGGLAITIRVPAAPADLEAG
jgi:two-component system, OmpR family, sensor histidine kinase KdpD